jgi:cysteinyl-tRNA synthetase
MHNGFVTIQKAGGEEEKMGKSKGNAFWLKDVFAAHPPAAVRLWILGTHYRAPLTYSEESLRTAKGGLDRIYNCLEELSRSLEGGSPTGPDGGGNDVAPEADARFREAMNDDFNTARALAVVYDEISAANAAVRDRAPAERMHAIRTHLRRHLNVLGLPLERPAGGGADLDEIMQVLLEVRAEARKEKQFGIADLIRDRLGGIGIRITDRPDGTTWTAE